MNEKKLAPGEFRGTCNQPTFIPAEDLGDRETVEGVKPRADRANNTWLHPVPCPFTTSDKAAWTEHLKEHGRTEAHIRASSTGYTEAYRKSITRPWRAPRLTEDGTTFDPRGLEPGATVTYEGSPSQGIPSGTGTVWCAAPGVRSVFVTPDVPVEDVRFLEVDAEGYITEVHRAKVRRHLCDQERAA